MLNNQRGEAFTDDPFFNPEFISRNNIRKMEGEFVYKKEGETMKSTTYKYVYKFDKQGRVIEKYETRPDDGTKDTTFVIYHYKEDRLYEMGIRDTAGETIKRWEFDTENRKTSEESVRIFYEDSLHPRRETILNKETYTYQKFDELRTKKTIYNSYGLPYEEILYTNSELGYPASEEQFLMVTYTRREKIYNYNSKGYLSSIISKPVGQDTADEEIQFTYDEFGNLDTKKLYQKGNFISEFQFLYNEKSKLLTAIITKDVKTNFLMIIRFKNYEYYN